MSETTTISVLTGSSTSGNAAIQYLIGKNKKAIVIKACFRTAARAEEFQRGYPKTLPSNVTVEPVIGMDATVPESLDAAVKDAKVAILVTPLDHAAGMGKKDSDMVINMIQAAERAKVSRVIVVASWTVKAPQDLSGIADRFVATEDYLQTKSTIPEWVVLRGGYFSQNLLMYTDVVKTKGILPILPSLAFPPVDCRDIGKCAGQLCLVETLPEKNFLECSGPQLLTASEIVAVFAKVLDKDITQVDLDLAEFVKDKPEWLQQLMTYMATHGKDAVPFVPSDMQNVLGEDMPLTCLEEFLQQHLQ